MPELPISIPLEPPNEAPDIPKNPLIGDKPLPNIVKILFKTKIYII
ncbi:MAG: hypothetical protein Q8N99_07100 [Nanoarchaeota archaeon]|nr:hypothetical protein [Nanoarchaeota archaeon]